jgi:epoxyqueuosine reductase
VTKDTRGRRAVRFIDRILLQVASLVQRLLAGMHWFEKRYLAGQHPGALYASAASPRRAEEPFELTISEVVGDTSRIGDSKPYFDLDRMLDDGMETMSTILKIMRGVGTSFHSLRGNSGLSANRAGPEFYAELRKVARDYGIDLIGFTRVPEELIFEGKHVLYPNAIVCAQEMKRSDIETAPDTTASIESLRVYANLGKAMNRLAEFIRARGIPCQVGHPMMGLSLYTSLAARAGLGYFGRQGLLITPDFGVRQRLGSIYVPLEDMPWTDGDEHRWVLDFCDRCNLCLTYCPGEAIYPKAIANTGSVYTCIDNARCAPWFSLYLGCSICVKVCPFSRKPYEKIKAAFRKEDTAGIIED